MQSLVHDDNMGVLQCSKERKGVESRGKDKSKIPISRQGWSGQGARLSSGNYSARPSRGNSHNIKGETEPKSLQEGQQVEKNAPPISIPKRCCGELATLPPCGSCVAPSSTEGSPIGSSSRRETLPGFGTNNPREIIGGLPSGVFPVVRPWQLPQGHGQPEQAGPMEFGPGFNPPKGPGQSRLPQDELLGPDTKFESLRRYLRDNLGNG
jgi:hypothetical protein